MKASKKPIPYFRHFLTAPFIYGLAIPLVLIDLSVEIYHRVCFPLYRIPYVKRHDFIKIDRHKLSYLNWIEKINCAYCGYANGLAHYLTHIAGLTEGYWCGIKHEKVKGFNQPEHHKEFLEYGDKKSLDNFLDR